MANDVVKVNTNNNVPDYLRGAESNTGLVGLDQSDYKVPRIKLLQPLSPEVRNFPGKALPSEFWHDGANKSLGTDFTFVAAMVSKRVILWAPRDTMGGGMLAFSKEGKYWATGANTTFDITLKGKKTPVKWSTGKDVANSKLLDWGSSDPEDAKSQPAATLIYEYLCYLPDHPELSPCVMGVYRTGIVNAKKLNTSLLMRRKPVASAVIKCEAEEMRDGNNVWNVPSFSLNGYADETTYKIATELAKQYAEYTATYTPEEVTTSNDTSVTKGKITVGDEIPF